MCSSSSIGVIMNVIVAAVVAVHAVRCGGRDMVGRADVGGEGARRREMSNCTTGSTVWGMRRMCP